MYNKIKNKKDLKMNELQKALSEKRNELSNDNLGLEYSFSKLINSLSEIKRLNKFISYMDEIEEIIKKGKIKDQDIELEFTLIKEYLYSMNLKL